MKILFLGTSAGWPLPRLGCRCQICQSKDPKDKRLRPTILINDSLLIDCGPDIYHQLKKFNLNPSKIHTLILTHAHLDHILGFYDLTHIYNREKKEISLITTQEIFNGFRQFYHLPLNPFKPKFLSLNEVIEIENLKISLSSVPHNHTPTVAVKIKERKIFIYIPDLKRLPKTERKSFRGVYLLVLDGSSLTKKGQTKNHESILEGIRLVKDLNPKICYFTHIGHLTLPHQDLENYIKQKGKNIFPAYDGLQLEI